MEEKELLLKISAQQARTFQEIKDLKTSNKEIGREIQHIKETLDSIESQIPEWWFTEYGETEPIVTEMSP